MGKNKSLKAKLKAADRRRKRRPSKDDALTGAQGKADQSETNVSSQSPLLQTAASAVNESRTQSPTAEATNLIANTILRHVNQPSNSAKDAFVIATLRGLLRGSAPISDESSVLCEQLEKIPVNPHIDRRSYRAGMETILGVALQQENKTTPDAFLQYLQILSQ